MNKDQPFGSLDARLAEVLEYHLDPKWGTPFWIHRAGQLGFDPRREIRTITDLPRMGLMEPSDLQLHPIEHYIPKRLLLEKQHLVFVQTGGTLGTPSWTAYLEEEFDEAFVKPFEVAARHVGFPRGKAWLYVGPSGPHVIGRAADAIARRSGSATPFSVDFDSRWMKKLPADSFAAQRYLTHIVDQAMAVMDHQSIGVLFATPTVLRCLANRMTRRQRERIHGVHYGGTALEPDLLQTFQQETFPGAVHLSGYGNTLFGCCLELTCTPKRQLQYFPYGNRLLFGVLPTHEPSPSQLVYNRPEQPGRLVFSRLDQTMLLVNVVERDEGSLVPPRNDAPSGFMACGVASPRPLSASGDRPRMLLY